MLSLFAAAILRQHSDAKTIAMVRAGAAQIKAGNKKQGYVTLFHAALNYFYPPKPVKREFDDESEWNSLVRRALYLPKDAKDSGCTVSYFGHSTDYGNVMLGWIGFNPRDSDDDVFVDVPQAWLRKRNGRWDVELISLSASRFPGVNAPAYEMGNQIVVAGAGGSGENRTHVVLRLWQKSAKGRWNEVQRMEDTRYTWDSHYLVRNGRNDPKVFIARLRTDSPLTKYNFWSSARRIYEQQWRYSGRRYVRMTGHFENNAFLSLERFLLAMRLGNMRVASRYASPEQIREMRTLGASSWHWPATIAGEDEDRAFDLEYKEDYSTPPCRVTMKRAGDHWRIAKIDPRCTAKDAGHEMDK